ncbi:UvrD-helicase domain-containing protein [Thermogemmatispora sp.]|uniref:UvrD-helicase domain-containing protein n=1 Tax=Thermogemmatispora sp. TaxID=1968838 RepID=UPI001DD495CC|nr:UvrD-helicase domain-containing protein [Thermogemmatispora sp.]MBX5450986.1 UvrD-helicase domain-containing protein [Thermogemmatispora sp.]
MEQESRALATLAARYLRQCYHDHRPSEAETVPLDELIAWLGLEIATFHPADQPPGTYGYLEPGDNLIWICRTLPEPQWRFTLAHELGHVILHRPLTAAMRLLLPGLEEMLKPLKLGMATLVREEPDQASLCNEADIREEVGAISDGDSIEELLGPGQSYSPRSQRELTANLFAAELLMPLEEVRALYVEQRQPPLVLAKRFGVSLAAILNRLAGLLKEYPLVMEQREQPRQAAASVSRHYDEFQQAAITATTPALVIAGPGSGKTSTLIGRAEYLICSCGVAPRSILALTFSRKAAEEMQERLAHALRARLGQGVDHRELPTVSTFHAFCAELLRQYSELVSLRPDFALIDDAEGYFLLRNLAPRLPLYYYHHLTQPTLYFPDILKAISRAKDELVTPERYRQLAEQMREQAQTVEERERAERALEVAAIYQLYQEELERRGDVDFGGLIMLTVQLLASHNDILLQLQQRYQHILVDEFQDINRASGVLLRLLAGEARRVWVVGDANQAIYGFRGASPANITRFQEDYPGALILSLSRNYRSRPDIVALAEAFRLQHLEAGQTDGEAALRRNEATRSSPPEPYVTLAVAENETDELAGLIADLQERARQGYRYRDLVVLCRTRAQARRISQALAIAGLPVIESGGTLEQEHIKDALAPVLLLAGPDGMGLLRAARWPEHPLSQADIEALLRVAREQQLAPGLLLLRGEIPETISPAGRRSLHLLSELLQRLSAASDIWSLLAQYLLVETDQVRRLLDRNDAQAKAVLADYALLLQLARRYDLQQQRQQQETSPATDGQPTDQTGTPQAGLIYERARGFLEYLRVLSMLRQDSSARQQSLELSQGDEADVVRVMTVHASKGLEFPVIYLPGLNQQRFPAARRYNPAPPPEGMLSFEGDEGSLHEVGEACLFYVGITRARDHLVLSYSRRPGRRAAKPSTFLEPVLTSLPPERLVRTEWRQQSGPGTSDQAKPEPLPPALPHEEFIRAMQPEILSVSALECYQQCPRKYLYSYIYRFQPLQESYALFVQAIRKTLETLYDWIEEGRQATSPEEASDTLPTCEAVCELYSRHWRELGGQESPFASLYERHGREVAEQLHRKLRDSVETQHWLLGRGFTIEIAGQTIRVDVDRVEVPRRPNQPVRFVRTRFGRRKQEPEPDIRELLYMRAYREHYPGQEAELQSDNLTTGEVSAVKLGQRREQNLYTRLVESIERLKQHDYPAAPADPGRCPTCPFFLICPA